MEKRVPQVRQGPTEQQGCGGVKKIEPEAESADMLDGRMFEQTPDATADACERG
jgi:hypothetical protein